MVHLPLVEEDKLLLPFENQINNRLLWYHDTRSYIKGDFGSLENFADAHKFFGFSYDKKQKGWWFREWAPAAYSISLIGDFNDWDRQANPLIRKDHGVWEVFLPDSVYRKRLRNYSSVKIHICAQNGALDRIPTFIRRVICREDGDFKGQFLKQTDFKWTDTDQKNQKYISPKIKNPIIYEAHIGMAQEEGKVGTYRAFKEKILPKIKELGYNVIQLMAIQEHPYYASFGYQVSNFFAPSSRFGTPDDLRALINEAHRMKIAVIMDIVHSHAVKNRAEGLAEFDGTELYFNGWHPDWDSRLIDYGRVEVKRFLLSNIKYWLEEFHFDGFRFDGVTSMLYHHHGRASFNQYSDYFSDNTNNDAVLYLQLANTLIRRLNPSALSICEDMSGMPGACRAIEDGGLGFDYRLAMGIPDYWIKLLKDKPDEQWHMGELFHRLTDRRNKEKTIAYAESHDQALVGDKTIAFWLMDKHMYTQMSKSTPSLVIDRGIALHKMIRFITLTLAGEGYLNFMGNEFGHPEWIDFPREGNQWSYHYARRQWSLAESFDLKYQYLKLFDKAMIRFVKQTDILSHNANKEHEDNQNNVLAFGKMELFFVFNFSANSFEEYYLHLSKQGKYKVVFSSDDAAFGGFERIDKSYVYSTQNKQICIYLPARTAIVLKKKIN